LTRQYESAWQEAERIGTRLDPRDFFQEAEGNADLAGSRLAILRTDLSLRWEAGDHSGAQWYMEQFVDLGTDTLVALAYEEYCLREEDGEELAPADYLVRYPSLVEPLRRVLDIHGLIGSATAEHSALSLRSSVSVSPTPGGASAHAPFPEAGQTIGGFHLVEELGRGAFARVFLAQERQLADRPVALKVTRRGSREPQALARLQHTNIVPVYSHRIDPATGLHLLCMPYFGRITLSRVLVELTQDDAGLSGASLIDALDRLEEAADPPAARRSACRATLAGRSFPQAIAWWGARLAEALEHAHDRGILHRDIKPSNVLVMGEGMPMLLDFNLARESVVEEQDGSTITGEATLGGTVDYMAPEHLEALAEGVSQRVDGRSDIFGLGVLLYEAVTGKKPFLPLRKSHSVVECLLRAADDRRRNTAALFPDSTLIPPPLQAVIRRCLEPEAQDRYQRAADLATDLRAVADDLPLVYAREPIVSRLSRRFRRNRRQLAMTVILFLAGAAILGTYINYQFDRFDRYNDVNASYLQGHAAIDRGDFKEAQIWLENAAKQAQHSELKPFRNLPKWESFWGFGAKLRKKLELLWTYPPMDELEGWIQVKAKMANLIVIRRNEADALLDSSEDLRFRLIGLGEDLPGAVVELKRLLQPFYVLETKKESVTPEHIWDLLDPERKQALEHEVDELLFLWIVGVENAWRKAVNSPSHRGAPRDPKALENAVLVCDRALSFAKSKGPWLALRAMLREHLVAGQVAAAAAHAGETDQVALLRLPGEPAHVELEKSASACFQWGLLWSSRDRKDRAIEWLDHAVWLDWSNYWYQFYLAYLEDQDGLFDDALDHYSAAVARQPKSAWVRFDRARLYRTKGRWSWALDDLVQARTVMADRPEARQVSLELGVLHGALGNFDRAAREYQEIIDKAPDSKYARAARLNLANIAAESGKETVAAAAYESLLKEDPEDRPARLSRAFLNLRVGHPKHALADLDRLLRSEEKNLKRAELLSSRAIALLLLNRRADAVADAEQANRLRPCPAGERLWQRTLLAAGRYDDLQLDRPEEALLLPIGGAWLKSDLRAATVELERRARGSDSTNYRAALNLAVVCSALGNHRRAALAADRALSISGLSPEVRLIRGRVFQRAGDGGRALEEVDLGQKLEPDDPAFLELRGVLLTEQGHPDQGLICLNRAITRAPHHFAHVHKAVALVALGRNEEAVYEWTVALKRDPELAQAYLGRAQCYVRLLIWDRALADLEQAAAWSYGDLRLQTGIMFTYAACLLERPDHLSRWLLLLQRATRQGWEMLTRTTVLTGFLGDRVP
jgi:serine/threonine protein kinase/predicted Zn-dependent protease